MNEINEKQRDGDPFSGYSSCPDKSIAYHSHSKENQKLWKERSEFIIREFIDKLHSFKNFQEAFTFLANKRHEIGIELKQKLDEGRSELYGVFRKEGDHYRKSITSGDGEQFWKWQKEKIFELTRNLIAPHKKDDSKGRKKGFIVEDEYMSCLEERVVVDDLQANYYCITIKFPKDDNIPETLLHAPTLSVIELYELVHKPSLDLIRIEFTPIDDRYMQGNYAIADIYYKKLLHSQGQDNVDDFFTNAAKLSYLTAHMLLVKHGNTSIVEWMLRALAFNNGLEIGRFNHTEGISWDFKAILTPNRNEYIKWYKHKLYVDWSQFDKNKTHRLFSFGESSDK